MTGRVLLFFTPCTAVLFQFFANRIYSSITYVKINKPEMHKDTRNKKWIDVVGSLCLVCCTMNELNGFSSRIGGIECLGMKNLSFCPYLI